MSIPDLSNSAAVAVTGFRTPLVHEVAASIYDHHLREERDPRLGAGTLCTPRESC